MANETTSKAGERTHESVAQEAERTGRPVGEIQYEHSTGKPWTPIMQFRWEGAVRETHALGHDVSAPANGVNVELVIGRGQGLPDYAEVYSDDQRQYAEIGLRFEGRKLCDYDGVFELPLHVAALLVVNGYEFDEFIIEDSDKAEVAALAALVVEGGAK